jgi:O-antigen ligase
MTMGFGRQTAGVSAAVVDVPLEDRRAEIAGAVLVSSLAGLLIVLTLCFGGVTASAILLLEAGAAALLLLWLAMGVWSESLSVTVNGLFAPGAVLLLLSAVQLTFNWTAYRYSTEIELLKYVAYGLLLFVATQCFTRPAIRRLFASIALTFGFLLAVFAIVQNLTPNGKIYWTYPATHGGWIFGPYVNHNHWAGLMEMLAPFPAVSALLGSQQLARRILLGFMALLMAATIVLCGSRGGTIALTVQMLLLCGFLAAHRRPRSAFAFLSIVVFFVIASLTWLGSSTLENRMFRADDWLQSQQRIRLTIFKDTLSMVRDKPILGFGAGSFGYVYAPYRSFSSNLWFDHAHNDYLELAVELGLVGLAAGFWFLARLYWPTVRDLLPRRSRAPNTARIAALLACSGIVVHSFSDFNLHIPANAAWFFVLCALAVQRRAANHQLHWKSDD